VSQLVLSLFPGIGLLDMAFEQEGFIVVRGPDVLWGGDIRRFHPPAGKFDGVIGGPPCQSFSPLANLVRANGHEPRFGNLIPEFERCVAEGEPDWFVMENVMRAPDPSIDGYGVSSFVLDNSWLPTKCYFGQEQRRLRKINFGVRGKDQVQSLLKWIDLSVFVLPDASRTVTQYQVDNSPSAKTRKRTVTSNVGGFTDGSPNPKHRHETVTGGHDRPPSDDVTVPDRWRADGGRSKRMARYGLRDACRLQGLPEDFLDDAPFTADGKLKAVANGVPLPMGRAIAKAVREAIR
jgi:DNA (cytosine-5)-methyltransferase 1